MKRSGTIILLCCIVMGLGACDSGGKITEVGNPTTLTPTSAQAANGVTSALQDAAIGALPTTVHASAMVKGARGSLLDSAGSTNDTGAFQCTFNEQTKKSCCDCPGGGTACYTFTEAFTGSNETVNFDQTISNQFTNCVISSCSASVALTGTITGNMSGTFNTSTRVGQFTAQYRTAETCSGVQAGTTDIGFIMTFTEAAGKRDFSGAVCIGSTSTSFASRAELLTLLDPTGACSANP